jgi:hypothetical protein
MRRLLPPLLALGCSDYNVAMSKEHAGDTACADGSLPDAYEVEIDASCMFEPDPGSFEPTVEWQWAASTGAPGYDDVMMTPVVGDVDGDGMPEVVLTSYAGNNYSTTGALVILSGDGSGEEGVYTSIGGYSPNSSAGVALGDLDGDRTVEIVTITTDYRVLAAHADGSLAWVSESYPSDLSIYGYPAIADMDGDGRAEVVAGRVILNALGVMLGKGGYGMGGGYSIPVIADLDADGVQEVVVGNAAYMKDGTTKWSNSNPDTWPAVADFDGDGQGEVATVYAGSVYLADTDGSAIWGPATLPGGGGGPPTIADFDGDGAPEIGVAGASYYAVFDTDGSLLWSMPTTDASSSQTGSSVFDFEGDGAAEVVYADELTLWVYDGATGLVELQDDGHSSWTLFEYPVIADVDADGEAEIILASNDSINAGWQGITVIGDATNSWAPTAPVWNQHAYSITNVEDDLSIPTAPTMNWLTGHNSFRAGGKEDVLGNPGPDLVPVVNRICACDGAAAQVVVQVENRGGSDVTEDFQVAVYSGGALIEVGELPGGVAAGTASEGFELTIPAEKIGKQLQVVADDDGTGAGVVTECDEDNGTEAAAPECDE